MSSTLSLPCSKKLYELLGDTYETESFHEKRITDEVDLGNGTMFYYYKKIPLPSFSEMIRLLPRIAEKKRWQEYECPLFFQDVGAIYMSAPTEEEGMERVSNYLEALL